MEYKYAGHELVVRKRLTNSNILGVHRWALSSWDLFADTN